MGFEDFGPEARKFHPEAKIGGIKRHETQREGAARLLREAGFTDIKIEKAFEMEMGVETKPGEGVVKGENGSKMTFPFLICIAREA